MIYSNNVLREVENRYRAYRKTEENRLRKYYDVLFADETYLNAYNAYKTAKFDYGKAKYEKDEKSAFEASKIMEGRKAAMKERRIALGISDEMIKPRRNCRKCNDTGTDPAGRPCECFYRIAHEVITDDLGVENKQLKTFDDFKSFGDERLVSIKNKLKKYCETFKPGSKNLYINGQTGLGKTFFANCIASEIQKKGYEILFLSAYEINNVFLRYANSDVATKLNYFDLLTTCDLLVIDDLGCEPLLKNVTNECLYAIISDRLTKKKTFIITTNLELPLFISRYGERFLSRTLSKDSTVSINLSGADKRMR